MLYPVVSRAPGRLSLAGFLGLLALSLTLLLGGCGPVPRHQNQLQAILERGELRVGTLNSSTTYYEDKDGPAGIEYELAKGFADYLGVKLQLVTAERINDLFTKLDTGEVDLLAAGLTVTPQRMKQYRFGPTYYQVSQKVVFRKGNDWPRNIDQLHGVLMVSRGSSYAETLTEMASLYPELTWQESDDQDTEGLLQEVLDGTIDYTVADSNQLAAARRFHPKLSIAFSLTKNDSQAWALKKNDDDSLLAITLDYFNILQSSGELVALQERYFGHISEFDYVDTRAFMRAVDRRLPKYQELFEKYSRSFDWRLLAAVSYQESHWNPRARSHTGVRGMMMLTLTTAGMVGVENRLSASQSIRGGAEYLETLLNRIPEKVDESERVWFALAAYNVGLGHLIDASDITEKRGGNRYRWADVKENLPLLTQKKWYRQTRYGYARGDEPVHYVDNIRRYYETLVWLDNQKQAEQQANNEDNIPTPSTIEATSPEAPTNMSRDQAENTPAAENDQG